jgi:hypothetical protein
MSITPKKKEKERKSTWKYRNGKKWKPVQPQHPSRGARVQG